jgi:hypothetical protein
MYKERDVPDGDVEIQIAEVEARSEALEDLLALLVAGQR